MPRISAYGLLSMHNQEGNSKSIQMHAKTTQVAARDIEVFHLHSKCLTGLHSLGKLTHRLLASATIKPSRSVLVRGCTMTAAGGIYAIMRQQTAAS